MNDLVDFAKSTVSFSSKIPTAVLLTGILWFNGQCYSLWLLAWVV